MKLIVHRPDGRSLFTPCDNSGTLRNVFRRPHALSTPPLPPRPVEQCEVEQFEVGTIGWLRRHGLLEQLGSAAEPAPTASRS